MIDFTNITHQRGIVILSSQEYRKLADGLFKITVNNKCIECNANDIDRHVQILESEDSSNMRKAESLAAIKFWVKTIEEYVSQNKEKIDKISEILR